VFFAQSENMNPGITATPSHPDDTFLYFASRGSQYLKTSRDSLSITHSYKDNFNKRNSKLRNICFSYTKNPIKKNDNNNSNDKIDNVGKHI